jgi:LysR family glycine cleavage system transcriptional activator
MHKMPEVQVPGFYLVVPKAHRRVKTIATFCRWIEAENWNTHDDKELRRLQEQAASLRDK